MQAAVAIGCLCCMNAAPAVAYARLQFRHSAGHVYSYSCIYMGVQQLLGLLFALLGLCMPAMRR